MIRKELAVAFAVAVCSIALSQTDKVKTRLLERYPAADLNKDGALSESELTELKRSVRKNRGPAASERSANTGAFPAPAARPTKEEKKARRQARMRVQPSFTNAAYGPFERNVLDFWKAESPAPAPVMVLIHAGGFTGGDKSFWYSHPLLSFCHEHGIAVAAINYRLITTDRYPAPMYDGARAVQFLRSKAAEWNIDDKRIAAAGGSAGACIAVWLGMHDDMGDPKSPDPVARESTRLSFVVSYDGQTSLDPELICKINPIGKTHPWFGMLFGASSAADFDTERVRKLIYDATATNFVSKDDPPVYMNYQMDLTPIPLPRGEQNMHHPYFGVVFKEKMDAAGLESVLHYRSQPARPGEDFDFILTHFDLKQRPAEKASAPTAAQPQPIAPRLPGAGLGPTLGAKGRLLLEEEFDGNTLPKGWSVMSGGMRVADGALHASQTRDGGRLGLFSCDLPMQDAAIQIDFKFSGRGGLNVSVNPSPGELTKHGHLFSVMITTTMWNITEHNDKSDRNSQSKALASASETFAPGQWYTLLVENKGDEVVAQVQGKKPLHTSSKDFHVKKPGIEFRVLGRENMEINFDNLRVWELQ